MTHNQLLVLAFFTCFCIGIQLQCWVINTLIKIKSEHLPTYTYNIR